MPPLPFNSPSNPGSFMLEIQEQQNYSPPRDRRIYLMYFLAELRLSCDIQSLTPLTFSSNSVSSGKARAWSCVSPEQECALLGTDLIPFVKPCTLGDNGNAHTVSSDTRHVSLNIRWQQCQTFEPECVFIWANMHPNRYVGNHESAAKGFI